MTATRRVPIRHRRRPTASAEQLVEQLQDQVRTIGRLLLDVTAERDRFRQHSIELNGVAWRIHEALGELPANAVAVTVDETVSDALGRLIADRNNLATICGLHRAGA